MSGLVAASIALLALLPGDARAQQGEGASKVRYTVAAMGDSLTDFRSHGGKYLQLLAEKCPNSRFDSYGIGGQMVNQMRARFERDILGVPGDPQNPKPRYTHVIVFGGVNDVCSDETAKRTPSLITGDLGTMYESAKRNGIKVIALEIAPWGGFKKFYNPRRAAATRLVNQWIRGQAAQGLIDAVFDPGSVLTCGESDRLCKSLSWKDGLHFNAAGHRKLGEALYQQYFADCQ